MWRYKGRDGERNDPAFLVDRAMRLKTGQDEFAERARSTRYEDVRGDHHEAGESLHVGAAIHFSGRLPAKQQGQRPEATHAESRFKAEPAFAEKYTKAIKANVELGFARRLLRHELEGPPGRTWYLPHFLVVNPNKPDKPRLVFDAAAKYQGVCLNDVLHSGPVMLIDLHDLRIMFRQNPVAVSMDVEKMFLQIRVRPQNQSVLRLKSKRCLKVGPKDV